MTNANVDRRNFDDSSYDASFFAYTDRMAVRSARQVLPVVKTCFPVGSVVDFGCGHGGWLAVWKELGVSENIGVDGDYVDRNSILIDTDELVTGDLSRSIDLGRRFDLVQSLEVAEHIPTQCAGIFVDTLVRHGDLILFSAAVPGQGGLQHVNEQPYEFWRELFGCRGFVMLDCIRPAVAGNVAVEPWYRYNMFVYLRHALYERLPSEIKSQKVAMEAAVPDVSPLSYRCQKAIIRQLPLRIVNCLSQAHAWWAHRR